ncbi:MAG: hypothetical protein GX326_04660 [Clostridiaceae bacterium]|nr:hypothetical protein [Clostridiaceae bacterium]
MDDKKINANNKRHKKVKATLKKRIVGKPTQVENNTFFSSVAYIIRKSFSLIIILILFIGFLLGGIGTGMLAGYISTAQPLDTENLQNFDQTTILLDMNGDKISELSSSSGSKSEYVTYSQFADTYIDDAFIAIEDERFKEHPGIDAKRIASSIFSAIANAGTPTHGGSTITQQTIKMISGADDISAQRKIQEWYAAVELEKELSKEGIIELYVNLVPMSNNITGVGAAAKYYFNKDVSELSLLECAFLVGIPNQPAIYNPLTEHGRRNALRRMRTTLAKMNELEIISDEEYRQTLDQEIVFDFQNFEVQDSAIYSWFEEHVINTVIEDLITKNGYSPELAMLTVSNQGLTIETTLDPVLQKRLEEVYLRTDIRTKDPSQLLDSPVSPQSAITVLENNPTDPGRIRGMVGGFGRKSDNFIFNRATDAKRQPASAIKPILIYAPGIDAGIISDATIFDDKPVQMDPMRPNVNYPLNAYRSYLGKINLETALVRSTNTVAADTFMNIVTPEVGLTYLKELGIDRMDAQYPSTALGGFEIGVSTLEMAGAFSSLANDGIYVEPTCYTRVLRHDGTVLLDNTAPTQTPVFSPGTADIMTKNLEKIAENVNAIPDNMHAAGKTGTSEDVIDAWFCGYTPYYTAAVWYGFDNTNGRKMEIPWIDVFTAVDIWNVAMTSVHQDLPNKEFEIGSDVKSVPVCSVTGELASAYCPGAFEALLLEGSTANPETQCSYHFSYVPSAQPTQGESIDSSSEPTSSDTNIDPNSSDPPSEQPSESTAPEPPTDPVTPTEAPTTQPPAPPEPTE